MDLPIVYLQKAHVQCLVRLTSPKPSLTLDATSPVAITFHNNLK